MKEEILGEFSNANVELSQGSGGDFIVNVDGKIIFSKNDDNVQRFPNEGEITELLKKAGY